MRGLRLDTCDRKLKLSGLAESTSQPRPRSSKSYSGQSSPTISSRLDLSNISFMDSTGLDVIVAANLRSGENGSRLVAVRIPPQIRRLFEITRLADHREMALEATEPDRSTAT